MASDFQKPGGWRFDAGGVNLRSAPDALAPNKYACAFNVRWISDHSVRTRSGWVNLFSNSQGVAFTDLKAYAALGTDDAPRILARDIDNNIVLDNGAVVATMAGALGYGASMLPFRPSASPQTWMYVASQYDYQKFSAPDANNNVTQAKVGIAEPQNAAQAAVVGLAVREAMGAASVWSGTGSAAANTPSDLAQVSDAASTSRADWVNPNRYSVSVTSGSLTGYQQGALVSIAGSTTLLPILELRPDIGSATIAGVLYNYTGDAPFSPNITQIAISDAQPGLDHGSMASVNTSFLEAEIIHDVIQGPGGESFTMFTSAPGPAVGGPITGVPVFIIETATQPAVNDSIQINAVQIDCGTDSGTLAVPVTGGMSRTYATSPFLGFTGDDYVNVIVSVSSTDNLISLELDFDVGDGSFTNVFSYILTRDQLTTNFGPTAAFKIPIASLQGSGGSLSGCTAVRVQTTCSGAQTLTVGSLWIGGGANPDIGDDGVPYQYRVVPRSSMTGAMGNPSPVMRYGVRPRRQTVQVNLPSAAYDSQIDVWDVYRYGGSITSYRYIGSAPAGASYFVDNVSDAGATAGQELETDNFEPWPSIDVPFQGTGLTVTLTGSILQATGGSWPLDVTQWLPGTLVQVDSVYTLRTRPVAISGGYQMEVEECGGSVSTTQLIVQEPNIAGQSVPYLWGPDEQGVMFAVGDLLRPGTLYYSKPYAPDSAPDVNTVELCPPSEPLIGGRAINGVSYVGSSKRWWALYPSFSVASAYSPVSQPVGRPLVSPYGLADDGTQLFFWTTDGIVATSGGPFTSLTDDDLYPLFPHEGVSGADITRNGITFYAPDYGRIGQFRLAHYNGYLYADYVDTTGHHRTLVCDLRNKAWSGEDLNGGATEMTVHYGIEQQTGNLVSGFTRYHNMLVADTFGSVNQQKDGVGDITSGITVTLATFQWDGGDPRAKAQWGDLYLDCAPISQITATPAFHDGVFGTAETLGPSSGRGFADISLAGAVFQKFVGLQLVWTDYATSQASPTTVYLWQATILPQPIITTDAFTDWMSPGAAGAFYFRGLVLTADTFNNAKNLVIRNGDDQSSLTLSVTHNGQQTIGYSFSPFVSHGVRLEPQAQIGWKFWMNMIQWIADPWPELTTQYTPWMNLGTPKAKYLRGVTIPLDTGGQPVTLRVLSSDQLVFDFPAVTTVAGEKTPTAFNFDVPYVAHEVQIQPQQPCRVWYDEAVWDFETWPEYITESGPWLNLGTNKNKYMRALVLPMDTGGNNVVLDFASSDGDLVQLGPVSTQANVKSPMSFAFATPLIGHAFQIAFPNSSVRIWFDEAQYDFEEWPEFITETGPWMNLGTNKNKYMRGMVLPVETNGQAASFSLQSSDGADILLGPVTTAAGIKTPVPFAFSVPLIGHEFQIHQPSSPMRIWFEEGQYDFEEWPELIAEASPWMNLGALGAKYLRGAVIPCDTNGAAVSLTFLSSDGGSVTVGPFTTPASEKTQMPWAFTIPLVGHEFQLRPSGAIRVWYSEIRWDYQPWPELITEATGWLPVNGGDAGFLQGFVLPVETGAQPPQLELLTDTGQTIALTATVTPGLDVKTGVAYSLATPVTCHYVQIVPLQPCRLWVGEGGAEIKWMAEATPELAATWKTQFTAHGLSGFMHVARIEAAYASANPVTLTISVDDGTAPAAITLPATGGVYQKQLVTLTMNKGLLYQYSLTSSTPFQVFGGDWIVWVGPWTRSGPYVPYRNLGAAFGDGAKI